MLTKKYVYGSLALAVMLACGSAQAATAKFIASTEDKLGSSVLVLESLMGSNII